MKKSTRTWLEPALTFIVAVVVLAMGFAILRQNVILKPYTRTEAAHFEGPCNIEAEIDAAWNAGHQWGLAECQGMKHDPDKFHVER